MRGSSRRRVTLGIRPGEGEDEGGAEEAVVQRLRQHHVRHQLAERRREIEDLEEGKAKDAFGDAQHDEPRHLDEGLRDAKPAADGPEGEAEHRFGERLSPDEPATGDVLE